MLIELLLAVLAGSLLQGVALMIARRLARRSEPGTDALDLPATRRDLAELDLRIAEAIELLQRRVEDDANTARVELSSHSQLIYGTRMDADNQAATLRECRRAIDATNAEVSRHAALISGKRTDADAQMRALRDQDRDAARDREKRRAVEDEIARLMERADLLEAATFAATLETPSGRCAWRDCWAIASRWAWRRDAKGARHVEARCAAHERGDAFTVPFFDPAYSAFTAPDPVAMASWVGFTGAENAATTGDLTSAVLDDAIRRFKAIGPAAPCAEPALIAAATEPGANLSIDVLSDAIRRFHIVYGLPEPKDNQP